METKLNELWAKLVKNLAPEWCIKKGIRKENPRAYLYLLGEAKELEMIAKMNLSDDEILEREWSYQTVSSLLLKGRKVFSLIRTEEQLKAVSEDKIKALEIFWRKRTPSKKFIIKMFKEHKLCEFEHLLNQHNKDMQIISLEELLGNPLTAEESLWEKAKSLAGTNVIIAKNYAFSLLERYSAKLPNKTEEFLKEAQRLGADISKAYGFLTAIGKWMPFYEADKQRGYLAEAAKTLLLVLPDGNMTTVLRDIENNIMKQKVMDFIFQNISLLNRASKEVTERIVNKIWFSGTPLKNMSLLYSYSDKKTKESMLIKLINSLEEGDVMGKLLPYFPFRDLDEEGRRKGYEALIKGARFPVELVSLITAEEKVYVTSKMEEQAQVRELMNATPANPVKKLHPRAEALFLDHAPRASQTGYVNRHDIYPEVFDKMLEKKNVRHLIEAKATKWGITHEQYLKILQSPYGFLADIMKRCIR